MALSSPKNLSGIEAFLLAKYQFRHNPVLVRTEFKLKNKKNSSFQLLNERDVNSIFRELNNNHYACSISGIRSLLNSDFIIEENPFESYFNDVSKISTGDVDYIDQLSQTIKVENEVFWKWAFKKWLVNLVACALEGTRTAKQLNIKNGVNQQVLVFVGEQGIGKTTWLNKLLPDKLEGYLFSGIVNPSNKDTLVNLSENLIINLDELENLNKTELGSLKSLITQSAIRLRRAYGIYNENFVRRASFVGSVNETEFLTDTTGNRRYLVIDTKKIEYAHNIKLDYVYSQAINLLKQGFSFEFKGSEINDIDNNNNRFLRQSVEEELLLKFYRLPEKDDKNDSIISLTPTELINEMQKYSSIKIGDASSLRRLGSALHKYKFQKISKGNSKPYQLVRISEDDQLLDAEKIGDKSIEKKPESKQEQVLKGKPHKNLLKDYELDFKENKFKTLEDAAQFYQQVGFETKMDGSILELYFIVGDNHQMQYIKTAKNGSYLEVEQVNAEQQKMEAKN